ncbi:TRAF-like protein [Neocallimastix sp. 'constans']
MDSFFKKKVKCTKDGNNEVFRNGYYEWEIKNWDKIENEFYVFSPKFNICGYSWELKLYPKGKGDEGKNHLSLYLYNNDVDKDLYPHIYTNVILYIRNFNDYTNCETINSSKYFNHNENSLNHTKFINKSILFTKNEKFSKPLVENNKTIIGVYIRVYKYTREEHFINELKSLLSNDNRSNKSEEIIGEKNFEWEIEDWNIHKNESLLESPVFKVQNYNWKLNLYPNGMDDKNFVSLFLNNIDVENDNSLHICAKCVLYIRNINKYSFFHGEPIKFFTYFNKNFDKIGFSQFIKKYNLYAEFEKSSKALVEDDKVIIGAYICIYNYDNQERYTNELNKLLVLNNEDFHIRNNSNYEWKIDNWDSLQHEEFSPEFKAIDYNWKIKLIKDDKDENGKEYVSIYLNNEDVINDNIHICTKFILTIRNCEDYSCFNTRNFLQFPCFYDKNHNTFGAKNLIETKYLTEKNKNSKSLVENGKTIINAYIHGYNYEREKYKDTDCEKAYYFEWEIKNWEFISNYIESPEFLACNYIWKIELNLLEYEKEASYSAFLKNVDVEDKCDKDINVNFVLSLRNIHDYSIFEAKAFNYIFNKNNNKCGLTKFIEKKDLYKKSKTSDTTLIENDIFIIGGLIYISESK